jgi:Septum formation initiator.
MAGNTVAYDFSLFEENEIELNAVAQPAKKRKTQTGRAKNIIELPKEELRKNRRAKINPIKGFITTLSFVVVFSTLFAIVFNQVHLTELTEQINGQTEVLEQAQSREIYLEMKASENMNATELERYAREELGMMEISEAQITYINMINEDSGTVLQETKASWIDSTIETVKSWFS